MFLLALGSNTEVTFEAQRAWIVVFVGHWGTTESMYCFLATQHWQAFWTEVLLRQTQLAVGIKMLLTGLMFL
jgi:hypothetical protein